MKKQKNQSLVSIIMPVYNAGDFLVTAIESILNQTYQNFEFIIINDHSTDNSWQIIQHYQKKYPKKIRVINLKHTLNKGGDACANEGLKRARGKYIARMDADDISHPERLGKQVDFLESNPEIFLVGTNAYVIDKKGKKIGEKFEPTDHENILNSYFIFHPIIHPSAMFRRFILKKRFFYPKKFSANNDYYAFFKLILTGYRFANLEEKLLLYRIHGNNDTFNNMKEKFFNTLKIRLIMVKKYGYEPTNKQWLTTFFQLLCIVILPKVVLVKLYFWIKGISRSKSSLFNLPKKLAFS